MLHTQGKFKYEISKNKSDHLLCFYFDGNRTNYGLSPTPLQRKSRTNSIIRDHQDEEAFLEERFSHPDLETPLSGGLPLGV